MLPSWLVRYARARTWQPFHIKMHHLAQIGMNYWGGAEVGASGELHALKHASELLKQEPSPVVFDVGANSGDFTLAALDAFGPNVRIHAFEPSSVAAQLFEQKVDVPLQSGQVGLRRFGFSDTAGSATLHSPTSGSPIASLHPTTFEIDGRELVHESIELRTLDAFCSEHSIERIHYLKVDTEGHEFAVLLGAKRMIGEGRVNIIQFEFGEYHIDSRVFFRDLFLFLSPQYHIHRILPGGLWPLKEYQPELEVFRTANYLAIAK
ncbi:MAG: FkbM family methyltransferase [Flavobacteriales bacterium]|nr:FkbM family methyltransferase [Flavobacteriales bacterium]